MLVYKGVVEKGRRRGHELGYPTINIALEHRESPGIFAGRVILKDEAPYMAAIFIDQTRNILEAHVLDFSDDLYGAEVTVEVHKKLRDSGRYENDGALKSAIAADVANVREYFRSKS